MRNYWIAFLFVLIIGLPISAQTKSNQKTPVPKAISADKVGMSTTRLNRIDDMLKQAIKEEKIPGAVALVIKDNKIVYLKAFGKSDPKQHRNYRPDDIFRIASQTKAITATAVMMLWEEGKFSLNDPIEKYIPEFANAQILDTFEEADSSYTTYPAKGKITIRQLLSHTSGLGYGFIDGDMRLRAIYKKAGIVDAFSSEKVIISENVRKLAGLPLVFEPGTNFKYCEGLDVLGALIEQVSGMPLDQYFKQHIFKPLGMEDTWFYLPGGKSRRLVNVLTKDSLGWASYEADNYYIDYPKKGAKTFFSGGAGLSSTVMDYAFFLQMYLNGGEFNGVRLLSRKTIESMMCDQTNGMFDDYDRGYGLAFGVLNDRGVAAGGKGSYGTFDWGGYFNTQYFADPQEKIIGILFKQTQNIDGDDTGEKFRNLVMQAVDAYKISKSKK